MTDYRELLLRYMRWVYDVYGHTVVSQTQMEAYPGAFNLEDWAELQKVRTEMFKRYDRPHYPGQPPSALPLVPDSLPNPSTPPTE